MGCRVLGKGLSNNCKVNAAGSQDCFSYFPAKTVPPLAHFAVYVTNGKMHCLPAASFSEWRYLDGVLPVVSIPKDRTAIKFIDHGLSIAASLHCQGEVRGISTK